MLTSACEGEATTTLEDAVLLPQFGSLPPPEHGMLMLTVLVIVVPGAVLSATCATMGKLTTAPAAMVWPTFRVQVKVPVPPAAMLLQVQLAGGVKETSVVPAGIASVNVAVLAAAGPLLVTDCA